jgi:hypothetical protein
MSTENKETLESLQQSYSILCTKAGHLAYQVKTLSDELAAAYEQMRQVNLKGAELKAKEAEAKDAAKS